jgi:hypothetical protein
MRIPRRSQSVVSWTRSGSAPNGRCPCNRGADRGAKPALARMGRVLQASPCPIALQPTRSLDCASYLVAPLQALAQRRLETAAPEDALRRVRACQPSWINSFYCISEAVSLRESCIREMCPCSLSGGRRPARARASSDPTSIKTSTMIISSNSLSRGSGMPYQVRGVLLRAMSGTELSRVLPCACSSPSKGFCGAGNPGGLNGSSQH